MPALQQKINQDCITALKSNDSAKTQVLRLILSGLKNQKITLQRELTEAEVIKVLATEVKKRKDSIAIFNQGGRSDLAQKEEFELGIIQNYLPPELSDLEIKAKIKEVIEQFGALQFGPLMGKVMSALGPQADGGKVRALIQAELQIKK